MESIFDNPRDRTCSICGGTGVPKVLKQGHCGACAGTGIEGFGAIFQAHGQPHSARGDGYRLAVRIVPRLIMLLYLIVGGLALLLIPAIQHLTIWWLATVMAMVGAVMMWEGKIQWDIATNPTITSGAEWTATGVVARVVGFLWLLPLPSVCILRSPLAVILNEPVKAALESTFILAIAALILGAVLFGRRTNWYT